MTIKFTLNICKEINWQSTPICTNAYICVLFCPFNTHISVWLPCQLRMIGMVLTTFIKVFSHELLPTKRVLLCFHFFPLIHVEPAWIYVNQTFILAPGTVMHYDCAYMHSMSLFFNPPPKKKFIASCFPKVSPVQPFQTYSSNSHAAAGLLTHRWEGYYCKQSTPICVLSFCPFFPTSVWLPWQLRMNTSLKHKIRMTGWYNNRSNTVIHTYT